MASRMDIGGRRVAQRITFAMGSKCRVEIRPCSLRRRFLNLAMGSNVSINHSRKGNCINSMSGFHFYSRAKTPSPPNLNPDSRHCLAALGQAMPNVAIVATTNSTTDVGPHRVVEQSVTDDEHCEYDAESVPPCRTRGRIR